MKSESKANYTEFVLKKITVTGTEEVARRARKAAAEENTSVLRLVGKMLEDEMRRRDDYWEAYERLKKIKPIEGVDASKRWSREETHERRR
jgi:hypothetical protein